MGGVSLALAYEGDDDATLEPWCDPSDLNGGEDVDLRSVCLVATEILFILSGRKFGVKRKIIRPTAAGRGCFVSDSELVLTAPVREIVEVRQDGSVVDPSTYRLVDQRSLIRIDDVWPFYQRLDLADANSTPFTVEFIWGRDVPEGGKASARFFADQLVKYMKGDKKCALPDRMINVTRQGTSQTILDPSEFTRQSRTGLYLVDTWLGAVNPSGGRRRPSVMGPDNLRKSRIG